MIKVLLTNFKEKGCNIQIFLKGTDTGVAGAVESVGEEFVKIYNSTTDSAAFVALNAIAIIHELPE